MMKETGNIIAYFETLYPEYDAAFYDNIVFRFAVVGGNRGRELTEHRNAKFFSNIYELYLYAAFLGISRNHKLSWISGTKKKKFEEVGDWKQHKELVKFLELVLLTKIDISFFDLESMEEEAWKAVMRDLKTTLEEYANGGFDLIRQRIEDDPTFFDSEFAFIDLLTE